MKDPLKLAFVWVLIILLIFLLLFPFYIMFKIALSEPTALFQDKASYFLTNTTFQHFQAILRSGESFFGPLIKSLQVALWVVVFSLLISIPAAYGMVHLDVRLRYFLLLLIFAGRMIPEVSLALPISLSFIKWGLFDTIPGLILAHLVRIVPITCFILVGTFSDLPRELEDQAQIDGCSRAQALWQVVLPVSRGGLCVAAIFAFLFSWDEFIYASYLSLSQPTMPIKMFYYVVRGNVFYSAAYAVIITLPVLVLMGVVQRYLKAEYLSAGIKG